MAVKKKTAESPTGGNIIASANKGVDELFREHIEDIMDMLEDSEDKKEVVNFKVLIDCSESAPNVSVTIRYSQSMTDKRDFRLDDPNQGTFEQVVEEAQAEKKKHKKKKGDGDEDEPRVKSADEELAEQA